MDERIFDEFLGQTMLGVVSLGLGLIILALDHRSRSNLALGIFWILAGCLTATFPLLAGQADPENTRLVERLHAVLIGSIPICVGVYIAGLLTTAQVTFRARRVVISAAILGSVLAGCFAALGVALPLRVPARCCIPDGAGRYPAQRKARPMTRRTTPC